MARGRPKRTTSASRRTEGNASAPVVDEIRAAVAYFARIATCFERRRDGAPADQKAEQLLRHVSKQVLKYRSALRRRVREPLRSTCSETLRRSIATIRRTGASAVTISGAKILDHFRSFGVVLKPHHIDRMAPSRKEIGLKGPKHFAEVALGENILGVGWRTIHNWRVPGPAVRTPHCIRSDRRCAGRRRVCGHRSAVLGSRTRAQAQVREGATASRPRPRGRDEASRSVRISGTKAWPGEVGPPRRHRHGSAQGGPRSTLHSVNRDRLRRAAVLDEFVRATHLRQQPLRRLARLTSCFLPGGRAVLFGGADRFLMLENREAKVTGGRTCPVGESSLAILRREP